MGKRTGVVRRTREEAPPAMVRIAWNRVRPILENWHLMDWDMNRLLTSVYLQGVEDTAITVFNQGFVPKVEEVPDYQI